MKYRDHVIASTFIKNLCIFYQKKRVCLFFFKQTVFKQEIRYCDDNTCIYLHLYYTHCV